jgi:zinc D-Ala-D-Ala carboxypeptidase
MPETPNNSPTPLPAGYLSKNFKLSEFACRCGCGLANPHPVLITGLQTLRDRVGRCISIISGGRCVQHNKDERGAEHSRHLPNPDGFTEAADIAIPGMSARSIYAMAREIAEFKGIGVDDERHMVHVDVRETEAKWCYHSGHQVAWYDPPRPLTPPLAGGTSVA